jgi:hypothetical protein
MQSAARSLMDEHGWMTGSTSAASRRLVKHDNEAGAKVKSMAAAAAALSAADTTCVPLNSALAATTGGNFVGEEDNHGCVGTVPARRARGRPVMIRRSTGTATKQ